MTDTLSHARPCSRACTFVAGLVVGLGVAGGALAIWKAVDTARRPSAVLMMPFENGVGADLVLACIDADASTVHVADIAAGGAASLQIWQRHSAESAFDSPFFLAAVHRDGTLQSSRTCAGQALWDAGSVAITDGSLELIPRKGAK